MISAPSAESTAGEDRGRAIIEASLDAIITIGHDGRILEWNPAAQRIFGWLPEQVLGRELAEVIIPPELRERHRTALATYVDKRKAGMLGGRVEMPAIRVDGSRIPVELTVVRLGNEWPPQFTGFICDISARKRAEEALRTTIATLEDTLEAAHASEERFRLFANIAHDAIWDWNLETDEAWWSGAMTTLFGYDREDLEKDSSSWTRRIAPEDVERVLAGIHRVIDGKEATWSDTYRFLRRDGTYADIEDHGCVIRDAAGKAVRMIGGMTDITKQREARDEILRLNGELEDRVARRTAQLEAANRELEAFSYSISHDLRAPLRAVDGFSKVVLETYGDLLPPEGKLFLMHARRGAQDMARLIDDLLAFSRLSRQPLRKQEMNTRELVDDALESVLPMYPGREGDIRIGALPDCYVDSALLKQVWINLLSNAFKYTGKAEKPQIEVGSHTVTTQAGQNEVVYFVKDNGAGFDPRYAHNLFAVFKRLHAVTEYPGSGVGLAIVQRIVARHGGRVWAEGAENRGATFSFTLG